MIIKGTTLVVNKKEDIIESVSSKVDVSSSDISQLLVAHAFIRAIGSVSTTIKDKNGNIFANSAMNLGTSTFEEVNDNMVYLRQNNSLSYVIEEGDQFGIKASFLVGDPNFTDGKLNIVIAGDIITGFVEFLFQLPGSAQAVKVDFSGKGMLELEIDFSA